MGLMKRGKYWNFEFQSEGKRYQGSTRHTDKEQAAAWLSAYRTNLVNTGMGLVQRPVLSMFLENEFNQWIELQAKTEATRNLYRRNIKTLCVSSLAKKPLDQISELDSQQFKETRLADKYAVATINSDLRCLRKALRYADRCGLIRYRPVSLLRGARNRIFVISRALEEEYLAAAEYPLKQVAILMLDLGLRPDEAVSLRKESVNNDIVTIIGGKNSNVLRTLPQTERTREVFTLCFELWPDSPWVFPSRKNGTHLTRAGVTASHIALRKRFNEAVAEAKQGSINEPIVGTLRVTASTAPWPDDFLLYSLRQTFGTRHPENEKRLRLKIEELQAVTDGLSAVISDPGKLDVATTQARRVASALQAEREELDAAREKMRTENLSRLTEELKDARASLSEVQESVRVAKGTVAHIYKAAPFPEAYPVVPTDSVVATKDGNGLPNESGIYFVWSDEMVVYVGQSVNVSQRARFGHSCIRPGDHISWLPCPKDHLNWAESFYIGLCRPIRNFGWRIE
jgi:integrase